MRRVKILVEGQTEEAFVRDVMVEPYAEKLIYLTPIVVSTSAVQKGGMSRYAKVRPQIDRLCRSDAGAVVSTFFDYYKLPTDFPGYDGTGVFTAAADKVAHLEQHLQNDVGHQNFIPHIVLHEFEALLLTNVDAFAVWVDDDAALNPLHEARRAHGPEEINDSVHTAPSKRIMSVMPRFQKTVHGPQIASEIGLDAIRAACPHFDAWLCKLDALVT